MLQSSSTRLQFKRLNEIYKWNLSRQPSGHFLLQLPCSSLSTQRPMSCLADHQWPWSRFSHTSIFNVKDHKHAILCNINRNSCWPSSTIGASMFWPEKSPICQNDVCVPNSRFRPTGTRKPRSPGLQSQICGECDEIRNYAQSEAYLHLYLKVYVYPM